MFNTENARIYWVLSTDTKPTPSQRPAYCIETDTGDVFRWSGSSWTQIERGGASRVAEVGIPSEPHRRLLTTNIDTTHPGDDTTCFTFTVDENVRRYRVLPIAGTAGDKVKVVEDAVNGVQADSWLTETSSVSADCMFWIALLGVWSEWKELSKDPNDVPLSRLDFELFTGGTAVTELLVEAE